MDELPEEKPVFLPPLHLKHQAALLTLLGSSMMVSEIKDPRAQELLQRIDKDLSRYHTLSELNLTLPLNEASFIRVLEQCTIWFSNEVDGKMKSTKELIKCNLPSSSSSSGESPASSPSGTSSNLSEPLPPGPTTLGDL